MKVDLMEGLMSARSAMRPVSTVSSICVAICVFAMSVPCSSGKAGVGESAPCAERSFRMSSRPTAPRNIKFRTGSETGRE